MWPSNGEAAAYPCRIPQGHGGESNLMSVIGFVDSHIVAEGQTLLDIARKYGLGYNQMVLVHPDMAYQKVEDCCEDSEKSAEEAKAAASRAEPPLKNPREFSTKSAASNLEAKTGKRRLRQQ